MNRFLKLFGAWSLFVPAIGMLATHAGAQTTIRGHVTAEGGSPLAAVSVSIRSLNVGATTDAAGLYSFTVPVGRSNGQTVTMTVRRIGFAPKDVSVTLSGGTITRDVSITATATELEGIVVTALGIEQQKSQLGTSVQQVSAEKLTQTPTISIADALQGKVAGLQITSSGTQGGSSKILIRGANSINGNNDPLFIIDGQPVSNADRGGGPGGSRADYGSAISDVNPDDVESISVLKGPNAAALYGSRASNGVILITTKRGRSTGGRISSELTTSQSWDSPSILPKYQDQYGQGAGGEFRYVDGKGGGVQDGNDQSYGPKLDGRTTGCTFTPGTSTYDSQPCMQFTGAGPWIAHPDNVYSFFKTGVTSNAYGSLNGGIDAAAARLSVGAENTKGYIPNEMLRKFTTQISGTLDISSKLTTTAALSYAKNSGTDRPGVGYNQGILEQFIWFGRQVDMDALHAFYDKFGNLYNWNYNYHNNPYFLQYANPLNDSRDRFIGNVSGTFKFTDWADATVRAGSDLYRFHIENDIAKGNLNGADPGYNGGMSLTDEYRNETDFDLLLTANHDLGSRFSVRGMAGGNERREVQNNSGTSTNGLLVQSLYNISNAGITPTVTNSTSRRIVDGVFGSASITFNRYLTIEGSLRQDVSSTLPKGQNSYNYPSINGSLILSDLVPAIRRGPLSYVKLRAANARVGADASPYSLATTFQGQSTKFGSLPRFTLGDNIANASLKPEITSSKEGGFELGFWNGRGSVDATWYNKDTHDQIIALNVSTASGFSSVTINAGDLNNKGFEGIVTVTPIQRGRFEWTSSFNYSHNYETVRALANGLTNIPLGSQWVLSLDARAPDPKTGQVYPYGTLRGNDFLYDSVSHQIMVSQGFPVKGPNNNMGNIQARWIGGFGNTLRYKSLTLSGLLDFHVGGKIFSISNMFGMYSGVFQESMVGREIDWNKPGIVVKGIDQKSCGAGSHTAANGTYVCVGGGNPNTTNVTAEQYNQVGLFELHAPFLYNDTYTKLRELRAGFDLPDRYAARFRARAVNVSFIGRNLWTWTKIPNIDPEFAYSTGNSQGMEFAALPNATSVGFNVKVIP
jgi:TonB-linked SusC/RagA family outer membrane protein